MLRDHRLFGLLIASWLALDAGVVQARGQHPASAPTPRGPRYRLTLPGSPLQTLDITLELDAPLPVTVAMPIWTPGAYQRRDWHRNVTLLSARTARGERLRWRRRGASGWRLSREVSTSRRPSSIARISLRYRVLARELADDASHVDRSHAHLTPTSVFLAVPSQRKCRHTVFITLPNRWGLASTLEERERRRVGSQVTIHLAAPGYDELADGLIEAGTFQRASVAVGSAKARATLEVVLHDARGRPVPRALLRALRRIVELHRRWLGAPPYRRYLVVIHTRPGKRYTALEHEKGTSALVPPDALDVKGSGFAVLLHVLAHEHLHIYNGRLLRPREFIPFDYFRLQRTRLLWWLEGVTDYLALLSLRRAGLLGPRSLLLALSHKVDQLQRSGGQVQRSLEEISYDAAEPPRDAGVRQVSYYGKGPLVALLLDLELRRLSPQGEGLVSLLASLLRRPRLKGVLALTRGLLLAEVRRRGGDDLARRLQRWIGQPKALPFANVLQRSGLRLESFVVKRRRCGFGHDLTGAGARVVKLVEGGAAVRAGLQVGDELLRVDGRSVSRWLRRGKKRDLCARLADGRRHRLLLRRPNARTLRRSFVARKRRERRWLMVPRSSAPREALQRRRRWLSQ